MGDVVIIGAGFAGLEAARVLAKHRKALGGRRVIVVDAKRTFDFLPMLPDLIGGRILKDRVVVDVAEYLEKLRVSFENGTVVSIDTASREVRLEEGHLLSYEFLVVCCGSMTNFYGAEDMARRSLKLDTAEDAVKIQNTVATYPQKKYVIVGGGYTGLEIATNIAQGLRRRRTKKYEVHIVERQDDIVGGLPEGVRDYCRMNLCRLKVHVHTGVSLKTATDGKLALSNGLEIDDYLLIWTAGVQTPECVRKMPQGKDAQGRLKVEKSLRFADGAFAAGDAAGFLRNKRPLRMAVQFSLNEGRLAASNIVRLCRGKKRLASYKPVDLGYLVPMANRCACGFVLFFPVRGFVAWMLHYVMCIYRSLTWRHRLGIVRDMFLR
ncbi:MAG: FAD-dependent oxidoreductase [Candidatus Omnitrophica bacterium]|nr:FAD-dependent oxidoreductase [Candidatus Omnitrophota bacterium]MDD5574493.1 FAD-dependent oxidoreductase [Candidatus Omnitrophota bacterium]